jgi:hypothetical protein
MLFRAMTSTLLQQGAVGGFFVAVWHRGAMTFDRGLVFGGRFAFNPRVTEREV